ncbi:MAG: cation diffusion facilitator family transporter [Spirochaetales bacterium]|nr:cation diffusion facilitator family transporter [Spirochaetales bacterium]
MAKKKNAAPEASEKTEQKIKTEQTGAAGQTGAAEQTGAADKERIGAIRKTSVIGILGNAVLAAVKIIVGLLSNSFALVSDGIDSSTDVLTSGITYFTAGISSQPPDEKHPYGHGRAETIAAKLVAFVIFFAGSQLIISALKQLAAGELKELPGLVALYAAGVSIVGKIILGIYKYHVGKKYRSSMILADAVNMRNDVLISLSVLAGIFFTRYLELPILDTIVAIGIGIWILAGALRIFLETSNELMDGITDRKMYKKVFSAAKQVAGAGNPHKTRIRKLNNLYIIDMDIEVDGELSVLKGHEIAKNVESSVRENIKDIYDVQVHIEPKGNIEDEESYGLSEDSLKNSQKE